IVLFYFFFQAEDGIRDSSVTGVQTCALPICDSGRAAAAGARFPGSLFYAGPWNSQAQRFVPSCASATSNSMGKPLKSAAKAKARSEERRVGKESKER